LPSPESALNVTVNVCDLPTSFVASGTIVMFASTHVFTAGPDPPGPAPIEAVAGSVSRVSVTPPSVNVAEALAVVLPAVGLEMMIEREPDDFVQKALQLVVDGNEPDSISSVMYVDLNMREHADTTAAKVFEGMGVYSPTLGIIGAVLGLMAVLQNLADPSKLGHGIAAAFTATIYGIGLANLFFLPVAAKLKVIISRQTQFREMVIDGMLSIAQGENPRARRSEMARNRGRDRRGTHFSDATPVEEGERSPGVALEQDDSRQMRR